jgi:hypothetical protein
LSEAADGVDDGSPGRASTPGSDPLVRIVFALLVVACFAAFLITQRLKHTPTAVQEFKLTPFFSPYPTGHVKQASIAFKLAHAEAVTVTIIAANGSTVATLVRHYPVARYKPFSLRWNGRLGNASHVRQTLSPRGFVIVVPSNVGVVAPAGEYRVRVGLQHHSAVLSPQSFTLVAP